ncbi:hypothetical protein [Anaerosolibacter carboniphilus]|nr:hypothetical protein [Anaerosolibacter carboniphilus]
MFCVGNDAPIVPKKIGIQNHGMEGAVPYEILYTLVGAIHESPTGSLVIRKNEHKDANFLGIWVE